MTLPATDSFTGTNGTDLVTYSGNWTYNNGAFVIISNGVKPNASGDYCYARWNADAFNADQYSQIVIKDYHTFDAIGAAARIATDGTDNCYFFWGASWGKELQKVVAGTVTSISFSATSPGFDTFRIEAEGTTITPIRNGSLDTDVGAQTDSSIAAGSAGLAGYGQPSGTDMYLDDWEGGNLGGAAAVDSLAAWVGKVKAWRMSPLVRM